MIASSSTEEIVRQAGREADKRRRSELSPLPDDGLAWLAAVPEWTLDLAEAAGLPTESAGSDEFLDRVTHTGWCENRASFVPGECALVITPRRPSKMPSLRLQISSLASQLAEIGLLPAPQFAEPKRPSQTRVMGTELSFPTAQLRCRSQGFAFRSFTLSFPGDLVEITLTSFSDAPPLKLSGEVFACLGDEWSGYETVVVLDSGMRAQFSAALYEQFSVPQARRAELIRLLPNARWNDACQAAAEQIRRANRDSGVPLPPATRRWMNLAGRLDRGADYVARRIIRRVEALLRRQLTGEVINQLDAANTLARTLGGEIESAVRLGQRRLELHYRAEVDARRLEHLQERPEQLEPFKELMRPELPLRDLGRQPSMSKAEAAPSPHWALHYIGLGGVGKTMLLRFLNRRLLQERRAVARVDFDYLSADFPVRRPAQLLLELADSLQLHIQNLETEGAFREFRSRADYIHRELNAEPPPGEPLGNLRRAEFETVLTAFCDFLRKLPQPVVLILDTCEELARLQPDGRFQPGVQATFEILERIQRNLAKDQQAVLRVIFAGRRLLAVAGADWRARGESLEERRHQFPETDTASGAEKEYLLLHEIRGFTRREALDYLARRLAGRTDLKLEGLLALPKVMPERGISPVRLVPPLLVAILERSLDNTTACDFEWRDGRPRSADNRYNPFNLSLYADWALEDPKLDAETIRRGGTEPYVEIRVIRHLRQREVLTVLPALLLLRRVEKIWLAEIFGFSGETLDNLYRELCQTEWMDYQPREDGTGAWLEVDRNLRPRMEHYFEQPDRVPQMAAARGRVAEWLARRVGDGPITTKPDEGLLSVAMRLLPAAQAAAYWARLETFVARTDNWYWVVGVCKQLLGEEATVKPPLQAAVNATYAAARLHTEAMPDVLQVWRNVAATAKLHPLAEQVQWLADRATAGGLAAQVRSGLPPDAKELQQFWHLVRQRPSPNWGGTIEALINAMDLTHPPNPELLDYEAVLEWDSALAPAGGVKSVSAALCLWSLAHVALAEQRAVLAGRDLGQRLHDGARTAGTDSPATRMELPDWPLPLKLGDRLRLDFLVLRKELPSLRRDDEVTAVSQWQQEAAGNLDQPDSSWLCAALLEFRSKDDLAALEALAKLAADRPYTSPNTPAQRRAAPLFIALARAWSELNQPEQALQLLDRPLETGNLDAATARLTQRAKAQIIHDHRLVERARVFLNSLRSGPAPPEPETVELVEQVLSGSRTENAPPPPWQRAFVILFGLAVLGIVGFLFVKAFGWYSALMNKIAGPELSLMSRLWPLAALAAVIFLVPLLSRTFRRWWNQTMDAATKVQLQFELDNSEFVAGPASGIVVSVRLAERRAPREGRGRALLRLQATLLRLFFRPVRERRQVVIETLLPERVDARALWQIVTTETRTEASSATGAEADAVLKELRDLLSRVGGRPLSVALRPASSLADKNWENVLARILLAHGVESVASLEPFRFLPPVRDEEFKTFWREGSRAVAGRAQLTVGSPWTAPFREAWEVARPWWSRFSVTDNWLWWRRAWLSVFKGPNFRVCHLVGEAVVSSAGVRFRVGDRSSGPREAAMHNNLESFQSASTGAVRMFSAEQLLLDDDGFFVVQQNPEASASRLQTDRERTAALRRFACELFEGGVWGVLFIPCLPSALAFSVTRRVARAVGGKCPPSLYELLALTKEIRREISVSAVSPDQEKMFTELAGEVTLFARSRAHILPVDPTQTAASPDGSGPVAAQPT